MLLEQLGRQNKKTKDFILGYRTGGNTDFNKYCIIEYRPFESVGIISRTRYGKSVLLKRYYGYVLKNTGRKAIIVDLQSEDHWRSKYPNTNNKGFAKGEEVFGIPGLKCFSPIFTEDDKHRFDKMFGFKITDTEKSDWRKLDKDGLYSLTGKGSALLFSIIRKQEVETVKDVIEDLEQTRMNRVIVNANLNVLEDINEERLFLKKNEMHLHIPDFSEFLWTDSVVVNFHMVDEFMGLYVGIILRQLFLKMRETSRKKKPLEPVIVLEEADLALNKENGSKTGCNRWVMEILRRSGKYKGMLLLSTQQASNLYEGVKNHIKTWIVGDLVPADLEFFQGYFSHEVMEALRTLNTRQNSYGAREWLLVQDGKYYTRFYPFNSPMAIHEG